MPEANDPFDQMAPRQAEVQPKLRSDLTVVYENQGGGAARIRLVDPGSGKQFSFSAEEHALTGAATGRASLREIHASHARRFPEGMGAREVVEFFRRLQILGLLMPEAEGAAPAPAPGPAAGARRRGMMGRTAKPAGVPAGDPRTGPRDEHAQDSFILGEAPESSPAERKARGAEKAAARRAAASEVRSRRKAPSAAEPSAEPVAEAAPVEPVKAAPEVVQEAAPGPDTAAPIPAAAAAPGPLARGFARRRAAQTGSAAETTAETTPEAAKPADRASPDPAAPSAAEVPRLAAPGSTALVPVAPAPGPERGDPFDDEDFGLGDGFYGAGTAGLGGGLAGGRLGARAGGIGGGMGGGMAGGFGGGGFGGGGFGGGGFGGGMAGAGAMGGGMGGAMGGGGGGERLLAALAARQQQMAGGAAPAAARGPQGAASLTLFNPTQLLKLLYILGYPFQLLHPLVIPVVLMAGLTMLQNWPALALDLGAILSSYATLTMVLIGLFTVNLASRLAQGVAIVGHGGKVGGLGLALIFGFLPRFFVDLTGVPALDRRGQLWAHGAPLLARLWMFAGGVLVWAITRDSGSWLAQMALIVGQFGLGMFLVTALPLVPADGMRWISPYLNEPRLLPKAWAALRHVATGRPLPPMIQRSDLWPLALFGIGTLLTTLAAALGIAIYGALTLETELGGLGMIVFLGLVAAFLLWLVAMRASIGRRAAQMRGGEGQSELARLLMAGRAPKAATQAEPALSGSAKVVWSVIGIALLSVAFLPYNYEAGGLVQILPVARGQAVARTEGEIIEIYVAEGASVTRGQVVAQMSSWNQANDVAVTEAMLAGAVASLARLEAGAKPEEIEVARRQLESAEASLAFSRAEAERARELVGTGAVSKAQFEKAQAAYDADLAGLEVARAQLVLVESGATTEEIAIARASVDHLTLELQFRRDELERTRITAPMDGRVVTPDLELRNGSFLRVGETLLEIENADVVRAAISVPESDIALIEPGREVRLKAWGASEDEIPGVVETIAQAAEQEGYGSTVRVDAAFPNPDGRLRSGMTGYAKIEGAEMRTWEAYLRRIVRFFQIEVWSWIP